MDRSSGAKCCGKAAHVDLKTFFVGGEVVGREKGLKHRRKIFRINAHRRVGSELSVRNGLSPA